MSDDQNGFVPNAFIAEGNCIISLGVPFYNARVTVRWGFDGAGGTDECLSLDGVPCCGT